MSNLTYDPIPCTGYRHIRSLECSVVGSRESPICGKPGKARVCEVASDQRAHVVQLFLGGLVSLGVFTCQQFRPTQSDSLSQTVFVLAKQR